jgi:lipoyl-dependent peroxiredoxin
MTTLYTAEALARGGRGGQVRTDDGTLDLKLSKPSTLGGDDGPGTNPEQLFAAGYAACFQGTLEFCARRRRAPLNDCEVRARVHLNRGEAGLLDIAVELDIRAGGVDGDTLRDLANEAHGRCPYSRAMQSVVDVQLHTEAAADHPSS